MRAFFRPTFGFGINSTPVGSNNLITNSSVLGTPVSFPTSTQWGVIGGGTASVDAGINIFTNVQGVKYTEDTGAGAGGHAIASPLAPSPKAARERCLSFFVKKGTCTEVGLTYKTSSLTANDYNVRFDINAGIVLAAVNITKYGIEPAPDGAFRIWAVFPTSTTTGFRSAVLQTLNPSTKLPNTFTGTGRTFYCSAPQIEDGIVPTAYII